jgi:hypothetical protein
MQTFLDGHQLCQRTNRPWPNPSPLNNADLHTKPLRCPSYTTMAHRILGQPSTSSADTEPPTVEDSGLPPDLHVGTKHLQLATPPSSERCYLRRKAHAWQYVTYTVPLSKSQWTPFPLLRLQDTWAPGVYSILPLKRIICLKHFTHSWSRSPYCGMTCLCADLYRLPSNNCHAHIQAGSYVSVLT